MGLNLDPAWLGPKGPGPKRARAPCRVQVKPHIWAHLGPYEKLSAPPIPPERLVYEKIQNFLPLAIFTRDAKNHIKARKGPS